MANYSELSPVDVIACLEGCVAFSHRIHNGGPAWRFMYPNGYAASVVKHSFSYGNEADLWEVAVLQESSDEWHLCYDTPITDDVLGFLEASEVVDTCRAIREL